MSCDQPKNEWLPIPELHSRCVHGIVIFGLNQHFINTKEKLKLKNIVSGWYKELDDEKIYYLLRILAVNVNGVVCLYQLQVFEEEINGKKVRKLICFFPGVTDPKYELIFWILISNVSDVKVLEVAKFAVTQNNKDRDDYLVFVSVVGAYYYEINPNSIRYKIHLKAKDCLGRVRDFEAVVLQEKSPKEIILKLEVFKLIPKLC